MSPYAFEFDDGAVWEWHLTDGGAEPERVADYEPSIFVSGPDDALADLRERLEADPRVAATARERWATDLHEAHRDERRRVLRVALERVADCRTLAREVRGVHERGSYAPGTYRLFDVDLAPGFRYCLDRGIDPTPGRELRTLEFSLPEPALGAGDVSELRVEGDPIDGDDAAALRALSRRLDRRDPDVLVPSDGDLVPTLSERASALGLESFRLGRRPGWTKLAGENTYASYGRVGYSPARYRVPGRAIVDASSSFLWTQSGLEGIRYMVERTGRPLQEAARGSIGTLLASRQVRAARDRGVIAPWNKWEPERFVDVETLLAADRGGFTFAPAVGYHETVHEIDFASLYPRIIREHGVSPETVGCGCRGDDGHRVPELGYEICGADPFLPAVLEDLLDDRAAYKRRLAADPPADEAADLRARSGAIKWVLVSCFGYQGYRNAKFGRIECHEAINAYARDIALEAKRRLEAAGWRIVHGIVDSLWVTPRVEEPTPIESVTSEITDAVGIPLEHDGRYEWVCFVPRRDSMRRGDGAPVDRWQDGSAAGPASAGAVTDPAPAGALTKYFGKRSGGAFRVRGIELRQRSTPEFVAESQRAFLEAFDRAREPESVCDVLERRLGRLRRGAVDPGALAIERRVSKPLEAYDRRTRAVAALERHERRGLERRPGQSVRYVVVDDDARGAERVRLPTESPSTYDADHYATALVRACESVVAPLGWDRRRIRRYLRDGTAVELSAFVD